MTESKFEEFEALLNGKRHSFPASCTQTCKLFVIDLIGFKIELSMTRLVCTEDQKPSKIEAGVA